MTATPDWRDQRKLDFRRPTPPSAIPSYTGDDPVFQRAMDAWALDVAHGKRPAALVEVNRAWRIANGIPLP